MARGTKHNGVSRTSREPVSVWRRASFWCYGDESTKESPRMFTHKKNYFHNHLEKNMNWRMIIKQQLSAQNEMSVGKVTACNNTEWKECSNTPSAVHDNRRFKQNNKGVSSWWNERKKISGKRLKPDHVGDLVMVSDPNCVGVTCIKATVSQKWTNLIYRRCDDTRNIETETYTNCIPCKKKKIFIPMCHGKRWELCVKLQLLI